MIFYTYIGYGLCLVILIRLRRLLQLLKGRPSVYSEKDMLLPEVTLVVAAYNEEAIIKDKIANCFSLEYAKDKLSFVFITDGSSDHTADIIAQYSEIQLLHQRERRGKSAALNRAMEYVNTPITVFCDANTYLNKNAIKYIVRHYEDKKTGGVSGEKRIMVLNNAKSPVAGEGIYWKYESLLKSLDSEFYTVTGAAGELFSIRTSLWEPLPEQIILDDFIISTRVNLLGYRVAYEPQAQASELPSNTLRDEQKRKVRISAGAFQAMAMLKPIFNVYRHPILFFQFFSHRILRWTLAPLSFPLLLLANVLLVLLATSPFYILALTCQIAFYLFAILGASTRGTSKNKVIKILHYIVFMNYSVYLGFFRFIQGGQSVVWEKVEREASSPSELWYR